MIMTEPIQWSEEPSEDERFKGYLAYIQCRSWIGGRTTEPMSFLQWNLFTYDSEPPPEEFIDDQSEP
jgi:hypothetical protein